MRRPLIVSKSLALRDSVAEAIVGALHSEQGVLKLRHYAITSSVAPDEVGSIRERLRCGLAVAEAYHLEVSPRAAPLECALVGGVLLFRAGIFFEVHEVLEAVWRDLEGERRAFVQGLIQIAVAMHHLAHENPRGAASLFGSGRAKLAAYDPLFEGVEVRALLAGLVAWEAAAAAGRWATTLDLPPFVVRTADGRRVGAVSWTPRMDRGRRL